ncbi:hypothetical protein MTR_8g005930 [Medicago truncatula]|uniref:Uncharacterized protein n=1 Tax=Medicago truncatula TaxID=3880 RepID=G7LBJ5_MEDTR|nr:hypothetical protein MTR_8g005930 [Medicago truncatula]
MTNRKKHAKTAKNHDQIATPALAEVVIPATSVRVVDPNRLKARVNTHVLTPLTMPIQMYGGQFGLDKNTSHLPSTQSMFRHATFKPNFGSFFQIPSPFYWNPKECPDSFQILGDEVEDAIEDTLSHDKRLDVEEDNDEALISNFEQHYPSLYESTKAERKKKKHVNKVRFASFNSVGMTTLPNCKRRARNINVFVLSFIENVVL